MKVTISKESLEILENLSKYGRRQFEEMKEEMKEDKTWEMDMAEKLKEEDAWNERSARCRREMERRVAV